MLRPPVSVLLPLFLALPAACGIRIEAETVARLAAAELAPQAARRCPQCGWIDSKREIVSAAADPLAPRGYEYTIRMADGSSRVFQQALPASWRLGERVTVIEGAVPD